MKIVFLAHNCNVPFIENELRELAKNPNIHEIIVFTETEIRNKELQHIPRLKINYYPSPADLPASFGVFYIWLREIFCNPLRYKKISKIKAALSYIRNESKKANYILTLQEYGNAVFYSYWADSEALILSLLKREGLKNLMVSRLHGYDVYEELDGKKGLSWRWFLVRYLDLFFPISRHGQSYFTARYPQLSAKTNCFYLGINQSEDYAVNAVPESGYKIVSCGWVNPHKNVFGIFRAVMEMPGMTWEHFGDGDDFQVLKEQAGAQSKIRIDLPGRLNSNEIFQRYTNSAYTCFISLSTTEGLPVSMMEAMAFGIPVVSTDVGGCSEIVNENTGVLLPENYTDEDVRNAIKTCAEKFATPEARKRIQDECRRKFEAKTNYVKFADFLKVENEKHWQKLNDSQ